MINPSFLYTVMFNNSYAKEGECQEKRENEGGNGQ
jgi:hypothetical protein